ncbi:MAG: glycosyltransferase family 2 protein [Pseudonocardiaceae bacterium]
MEQVSAHPGISVLTVTRRCDALERCLKSVACQDYAGAIEHVLVADDQPQIHHLLRHVTPHAARTVISIPREPGDVDGPVRLATLRNRAVTLADHELVAFLDDDNTWDPSHLSSLQSLLTATRADLIHSERLLFTSDGQPYLCPEYP